MSLHHPQRRLVRRDARTPGAPRTTPRSLPTALGTASTWALALLCVLAASCGSGDDPVANQDPRLTTTAISVGQEDDVNEDAPDQAAPAVGQVDDAEGEPATPDCAAIAERVGATACSLESIRPDAEDAGVDVDDLLEGLDAERLRVEDVDYALSQAGIDAGNLPGIRSDISANSVCNDAGSEIAQLECILAEALPPEVATDSTSVSLLVVSYQTGSLTAKDLAFIVQEVDNVAVRYRDYDFFDGVEIAGHLRSSDLFTD